MEVCQMKKTMYRLYQNQMGEVHQNVKPLEPEAFNEVFPYLVNVVSGGVLTKENVHKMLGRAMILIIAFTVDMEESGWNLGKCMASKMCMN